MKQWYVLDDNSPTGPFTTEAVSAIAKVNADVLVCPVGGEEWKEAASHPEFVNMPNSMRRSLHIEDVTLPSKPVSRPILVAGYALAFLMPIIGAIIGIYAMIKGRPGHGIGMLVIAALAFMVGLMTIRSM